MMSTTTVTAATTNTPTTSSHETTKIFLPANDLDVIQDMIDISAVRLEGLRTQCVTSATLTQQEMRGLESKLVRMFSELLLTKARLNERIPASGLPNNTGSELRQWLRVVGLSSESVIICLQRLSTLEQLMALNDAELKQLIQNNPLHKEEEVRRLVKAMQNLRKCKEHLATQRAEAQATDEQLLENLYWDSWDRQQHHHHHHHHHHRGSMGNIGVSLSSSPRLQRMLAKQQQQTQTQQMQLNKPTSNRQSPTLTPSPPNSPFSSSSVVFSNSGSLNGTPQRLRPSGTPPPIKKHQTNATTNNTLKSMTPTHQVHRPPSGIYEHFSSTTLPLAKSRSNEAPFHESSLLSVASSPPSLVAIATQTNTNTTVSNITTTTTSTAITKTISRTRLHTDPSPDSYSSSASSDIICLNENNNNSNSNNMQSNNKAILSNNNVNMNNNSSSSSTSLQLPTPRSPSISASGNASNTTSSTIMNLGMGHTISHRFTKVFKMMSTCDLCQKQMFFGLKCKECKYRCHKDCEINVPPSCGLPREFVDEFMRTFVDQLAGSTASVQTSGNNAAAGSPNLSTPLGKKRLQAVTGRKEADSSSPASSCNSSSPSSPALINLPHKQQQQQHYQQQQHMPNMMSSSGGGSSSTSSNMLSTPSYCTNNERLFNFPDVTITSSTSSNCPQSLLFSLNGAENTQTLLSAHNSLTSELDLKPLEVEQTATMPLEEHTQDLLTGSINNLPVNTTNQSATMLSNKETPTKISASVSSTSSFYNRKLSTAGVDKRETFTSELSDTHKSNDSDKTVSLSGSTSASTDSDRTPRRLDSTEDGDSVNWPRQNSLSLKEWDIPYGDLRLLEQIGRGRFGTVHRALWHGDVAVKLLKEDYLHDEHMLEAFKLEVANFKKTRHENLVLFMGACMNPPYLAIVTSLCKGNTLYTYIHARRDKFTINKTTLVAQQISQGMGYLHARGIYHKDLRTKNIFLENGKVIITDFGLFSSTKLLYCDIGLGVPSGWLCYLSPELMRALQPCKPTGEILPFSKASDVYSFGTVWYELLCGEFPFKSQPPESIIWQVGRGMKQTLANLQTSRDVKDILMLCWHYQADDRPDFPKLLTLLERLPKKRLARSPSHPVQLSRSAESVF